MSIRPIIETALAATAERLSPGSGSSAARHAKGDLGTIDAASGNYSKRYANEPIRLATTAVFEAKHPDGDPVTIGKPHAGLIVVFADSFLFVRGMGFGAREIDAVAISDVTVEAVTTVVDGAEVPGVRITGRGGKPKFAAAITVPDAPAHPATPTAVRDELVALLSA